jgi:hypothetical protein
MNRQQWKDVLESFGIIAIIASLIFVGIETRNSTKQAILMTQALEISAYQELMTNIEELNYLAITNDSMASVLGQFWSEQGDIEKFHEKRAFFLLLRHGDMAFYMYKRGAIDENRLRSAVGPIELGSPLLRRYWDENKFVFAEEYRNYIDERIAGTDEEIDTP